MAWPCLPGLDCSVLLVLSEPEAGYNVAAAGGSPPCRRGACRASTAWCDCRWLWRRWSKEVPVDGGMGRGCGCRRCWACRTMAWSATLARAWLATVWLVGAVVASEGCHSRHDWALSRSGQEGQPPDATTAPTSNTVASLALASVADPAVVKRTPQRHPKLPPMLPSTSTATTHPVLGRAAPVVAATTAALEGETHTERIISPQATLLTIA